MDTYFWKCAGIRAIKTFSQTMLSLVTVGQAFGDVSWQKVLSVSGVAAVLSLLTSLAGLPEVEKSVVPEGFRNESDRSDLNV